MNILSHFWFEALVPVQYIGIPSDGIGNLLDWTKEPLFQ